MRVPSGAGSPDAVEPSEAMKTDGPLVPPAGGDTPMRLPADAPAAGVTPAAEAVDAVPAVGPEGPSGPDDGEEPAPWHGAVPLPFRSAFAPGDLRAALAVAAGLTVLGIPVGLAWAALGPRASMMVTADGAVQVVNRPEVFIAADGSLGALGLAVGLLSGAGVYLWRRRRGPWMAIGLAVGSLVAAYVAAKTGHRVGLGTYQRLLATEPTGQELERPVGLRAPGMLFVQPLVAVVVYVLAAGWSRYGDLGRAPREEPVSSD